MLKRLWHDDSGGLLSAEWTILASVLVFGVASGLTGIRNGINGELENFARDFGRICQGCNGCDCSKAIVPEETYESYYPLEPSSDGDPVN